MSQFAHTASRETETVAFSLRPDGIVSGVAKPIEVTLERAQANMQAITHLLGGRRGPVVLDLRGADVGLSAEVRRFFTDPSKARPVTAYAYVVDGAVGRMFANMLLTMGRMLGTSLPMQLFDDEAAALAWARGHLPR